jgi:citrate synthase
LILCADHELNVSSFTARCVASAGATPYAVVGAGLAALTGLRHGGNTGRVEALFAEARTPGGVTATLARWVRRGEVLPGFGHRLYPEGDPRGAALLEMVSTALPRQRGIRLAHALAEGVQALHGEAPNIDFALVALARALDLPPGAPLALFALGRTAGWVGHALEQYAAGDLIRPRARYVGQPPQTAAVMEEKQRSER